jgi:hypothetical protein
VRKTFIGLLAASALFMAAPAQSHPVPANGGTYTFQGAAPCAVVCSYWVDQGFTPCENPFPPGSFLDKVTNAAPTPPTGKIIVLEATLDSTLDWDSFMCANNATKTELAQGANILGEPCDNLLGPNNAAPVGCHEDMSTPITAGGTVILRAYNWSDAGPAIAKWGFTFI